MSNVAKFDYVKGFEKEDRCLPNAWIVVRVNGKSFTKFAENHEFEKPNDKRGLDVMIRAAASVMEDIRDISLAYGYNDEFSFVFRKDTSLYNRRSAKITSHINSLFAAAFVFHWAEIFETSKLKYAPSFDCVICVFPSDTNLKDYLSWRQNELNTKNLYNTIYWAFVRKGNRSEVETKELLRNCTHKSELLFREFGINYYNEPDMYRKGTTLVRKLITTPTDGKLHQFLIPLSCDLTSEEFWKENPEIMGLKSLQVSQLSHIHGFMVNKPNNLTDKSNINVKMEIV